MLPRRIANRYAQALFSIAQERGTVDQWEGELATLATVMEQSPELREVLAHPEIALARKMELLDKLFAGKVAPEILALIQKLIKRGHDPDMDILREIFVELWNAARRVLPVSVTSAVPLSTAQAQAFTEQLAQKTGATIQLSRNIDPELIAGMVVRIGDRLIDASARGVLSELREAMQR
jgi:F-type H+-transporting ATPase subunit delta